MLLSLALASAPLIASAEGTAPDATIDIRGTTVAAGVGYTEAQGTLHYQGHSYPVQLKGLSIGQVAAAKITATGEVYHLAELSDFDGNFTAVSAGFAVGGGAGGSAMQNQKGVVMKVHSTAEGVDLRLSVDGLSAKVTQ
jgi:hypothetical protein